ncbi:MAG: 30S ribosomal protein S6 [Caldilineae bacterium]|nr:30S ribosomal protein S6 [Chloroflexota bacterium]MCB9176842.1 30S ribosomal protein S6 [Caldilineae bacterium]
MREYEAMFILQPGLDDDGVNAFVEKVSAVVTEKAGEVSTSGQLADKRGNVSVVTEGWKKRRLAYPIKGVREGYYVVLGFKGSSETLDALDYSVRYNEDVIRHLVLRTDED